MTQKKLYRTEGRDRTIAGVCGGIAEFIGIDVTIVRVIMLISVLFGTLGFWVYLGCALVMPKKSEIYE